MFLGHDFIFDDTIATIAPAPSRQSNRLPPSSLPRLRLPPSRLPRPPPPYSMDGLAPKIGVIVAAIGSTVYFLWDLMDRRALRKENEAALRQFEETLNSTTLSDPVAKTTTTIDRTDEKARIRRMIMEPVRDDFYVYSGPHKAGKSQAVTEVVADLQREGVEGVHYLVADTPLASTIAEHFKMLHVSIMDPSVSVDSQRADPSLRKYVLPDSAVVALKKVAKRLGKSAKRYPDDRVTTIIVDSVNLLLPQSCDQPSEKARAELEELIKIAKAHIDQKSIKWILIDSSGIAYQVMTGISAESRLIAFYSNDVPPEKAKTFLRKHLGEDVDVDRVLLATGGRVGLLKRAVNPAQTGEEVMSHVLGKSKKDLFRVFPLGRKEFTIAQQFQWKVLCCLSSKRLEVLSELHLMAYKLGLSEEETKKALNGLLKADLVRFAQDMHLAIHSNAVKYLVTESGAFR